MTNVNESEYYLKKWLRRLPLLVVITFAGMALVFKYYNALAALPWLSELQTFTLITSAVLMYGLINGYYKTKRPYLLAGIGALLLAIHIGVMLILYQMRERWPIMFLMALTYGEYIVASTIFMKFEIYPGARRTRRR